ncbi:MAG TPA: helix-turn-helix domain-containing protein [Desulfosporosinus sp.]
MAKTKNGMFIKTQIESLRDGSLNGLDGAAYKTMVLIATHQDKDGKCYPGQQSLADILGIQRKTVGDHIRKILAYRTPNGESIMISVKEKVGKNRYEGYTYTFLPASGLSFG